MNKTHYPLAICSLLLCISFTLISYAPILEWEKKYGNDKSDAFHAVIENNIGELVAVGTITNTDSGKDVLFARINPINGLAKEVKSLVGDDDETAYNIIQTYKEGYAIIGHQSSNKGKIQQAFLLLIDAEGTEQQRVIFDLEDNTTFYDIVQTANGDFYLTGSIGNKACIVKYNSNAQQEWYKSFETTGSAKGLALKLTANEDLIVAIHQKVKKKHFTILQRITTDTITVWKDTFPNMQVTDLWIEKDGRIAATGIAYTPKQGRKQDLFFLKVAASGEQIDTTKKYIRNRGKDGGKALLKSRLGDHYYAAGYNSSFDTNINFPKLWVHKIDGVGEEVTADYFYEGSNHYDTANDIIELMDGSIVVAGQSHSLSDYSKGGAWLVKLLPEEYVPGATRSLAQKKKDITLVWLYKDQPVLDNETIMIYEPIINVNNLVASADYSLETTVFTIVLNNSEEIELEIDGGKSNPVSLKKGGDEIVFGNVRLYLAAGLNHISIRADNEPIKTFHIQYDQTLPTLHLTSIGIQDDDLDYTTKDAADIASFFENHQKTQSLFKDIQVNLMNTKENTGYIPIIKEINNLSKKDVNSNDFIMLFISAHGDIEDEQFVIPTIDTKEGLFTIKFEEDILKKLEGLNCLKFVFIDACHSGKGIKGDSKTAEALIKITNAHKDFYIITSSNATEKSYEDKAWKNGAFTKAFLEALNNKEVPVANGERMQASKSTDYLSFMELFEFLEKRVTYLSFTQKRQKQTPFTNKKLSDEEDFPFLQHKK